MQIVSRNPIETNYSVSCIYPGDVLLGWAE